MMLAPFLFAVAANAQNIRDVSPPAQIGPESFPPNGIDALLNETASFSFAWLQDFRSDSFNVVMPSHSGYYFWAVIPAGTRRRFTGTFATSENSCFLSSLAAYDVTTGLPISPVTGEGGSGEDMYFNAWMDLELLRGIESDGIVIPPLGTATMEHFSFVLLRFYSDARKLDFDALYSDWLFKVTEVGDDGTENGVALLPASRDKMHELAKTWEHVMMPWVMQNIVVPQRWKKGTQFFMPTSYGALYPDPTNRYAIVNMPSPRHGVRITGNYTAAAMGALHVTYMDVIAVNGRTSRTDDALPHYLWNDRGTEGAYEVYVVPNGAEVTTTSPVLHWDPASAAADALMIVFRMVDWSCFTDAGCTGWTSLPPGFVPPARTAAVVGGLYPHVEYIKF